MTANSAGNRKALLEQLDAMSIEELSSIIDAAQVKREEKREAAKQALIAEIRERAAKLGIPIETLTLCGKTASSARARAKYRGPNGEEWTGRGKLPKWLSSLEDAGRDRKEFEKRGVADPLTL